MKKEAKTEAQIAAEKQEMDALMQSIITLSNRIPDKVINGSNNIAVAFKDHAFQARRVATAARPNLDKLRSAHSLLNGYYK